MEGIFVRAEQLLNWDLITVTSSGWFKLLTTHPTHYAKCSLLLGTSFSVCATVMQEETQSFLWDLDVAPNAPEGMDCMGSWNLSLPVDLSSPEGPAGAMQSEK